MEPAHSMKRPTLPLRCLLLVVLGFLWATMGSASAFAERGDFGRSSLAAKTEVAVADDAAKWIWGQNRMALS